MGNLYSSGNLEPLLSRVSFLPAVAARVLRALRRKSSPTVALLLFAVLAVGAGAATGTVLRGDIEADIPLSVSQALLAEKPQPHNFPANRPFFSSTSDDQTKFSFALEMFRGESLTVLVPILNQSAGDTVAEFSITLPEIPSLVEGVPGIVVEMAGSGRIDDVVRITPDTWAFTADADSSGLSASPPDGVLITFRTAPTAMGGHFVVTGRIRTVEY